MCARLNLQSHNKNLQNLQFCTNQHDRFFCILTTRTINWRAWNIPDDGPRNNRFHSSTPDAKQKCETNAEISIIGKSDTENIRLLLAFCMQCGRQICVYRQSTTGERERYRSQASSTAAVYRSYACFSFVRRCLRAERLSCSNLPFRSSCTGIPSERSQLSNWCTSGPDAMLSFDMNSAAYLKRFFSAR